MKANKEGHKALRKGRYSQQGQYYLITTATHKRQTLFDDFCLAQRVVQCLYENEIKCNSKWLAWVLMPDHFHGLLELGEISLSKVVANFKGHSSFQVNKLQNKIGKVWQKSFHDHALRKDEDLKAISRYIIANPLRAGLVKNIGDYPYWNAVWL